MEYQTVRPLAQLKTEWKPEGVLLLAEDDEPICISVAPTNMGTARPKTFTRSP